MRRRRSTEIAEIIPEIEQLRGGRADNPDHKGDRAISAISGPLSVNTRTKDFGFDKRSIPDRVVFLITLFSVCFIHRSQHSAEQADPAEASHSSVRDSNRIIEMLDSKAVRAEKGERVEKHVLITYIQCARKRISSALRVRPPGVRKMISTTDEMDKQFLVGS